jgi:hypothetical protein
VGAPAASTPLALSDACTESGTVPQLPTASAPAWRLFYFLFTLKLPMPDLKMPFSEIEF